jgi:ribonuclease Y
MSLLAEPLGAVVLALLAMGVGAALARLLDRAAGRDSRTRAEQIIAAANAQAEHLLREAELKARDELFHKREELNREVEASRAELREQERRIERREDQLAQRELELTRKLRALEASKTKLAERRQALDERAQQLEQMIAEQSAKLHELAQLSREQAERLLFERLEAELSAEIGQRLQRHEELVRASAEERARHILIGAIQRYAAEQTAETTVSTIDIPSDEMKGRIIGREGRNIRTFEKCTGVDVIVDDTPGVVVVSAFDNIRREVARIALTKLIQDGRIHPSRIEEVVAQTQEAMEKTILETGRQAAAEVGIPVLHEKILQLLGRLKFRTSYSQNVLLHSLEVAHLCGLMADELGLDGDLARRCGLLHDIGKAADHEMEGGHPAVGAELARRYGETNEHVLHAIQCHHDTISLDHVYTVLVAAADAISASRPGARRETLDKYVNRLMELEQVACGFPGVEQAFAIQAGRELRVIANAARTSDSDAVRVCREIAKAIEEKLDYPGEIKVTVVREMRAVEYAR